MFNVPPTTFVRVSMGCQFAGTRASVDSIFQMVPGGVRGFNVGVAGGGTTTWRRVGGGGAGRERKVFAEVGGGCGLRDAGGDGGGSGAVAGVGGGGGRGGVGEGGREPVCRWCVGVVAPGYAKRDQGGPVRCTRRGD